MVSAHSSTGSRDFSVEEGFNVCLFFFHFLWKPIIEPKMATMEHEEAVVHRIFFKDVCIGFESSAEWNEAIFRTKNVPKEEQKKGLRLTSQDVFACGIEFCKIYDEIFEFNLVFILRLLESMKLNPDGHKFEWSLWEKALVDSSRVFIANFNWNDTLTGGGVTVSTVTWQNSTKRSRSL